MIIMSFTLQERIKVESNIIISISIQDSKTLLIPGVLDPFTTSLRAVLLLCQLKFNFTAD